MFNGRAVERSRGVCLAKEIKRSDPPSHEQTRKPTETACAESAVLRTIAPEQLRKWASDHRNRLQETRRTLQEAAARLEKEIAACDQMLAELTT